MHAPYSAGNFESRPQIDRRTGRLPVWWRCRSDHDDAALTQTSFSVTVVPSGENFGWRPPGATNRGAWPPSVDHAIE
jgi:hypothetical protein